MHSETNNRADRADHTDDDTDARPLRPQTVMTWHPADEGRVKQAFAAGLEALQERASSSRFILEDPHAYGLADAEKLRHQIGADDRAALVIRSVLDGGMAQDPE